MQIVDIVFLAIVVSSLVVFAASLAYADRQTNGRL